MMKALEGHFGEANSCNVVFTFFLSPFFSFLACPYQPNEIKEEGECE